MYYYVYYPPGTNFYGMEYFGVIFLWDIRFSCVFKQRPGNSVYLLTITYLFNLTTYQIYLICGLLDIGVNYLSVTWYYTLYLLFFLHALFIYLLLLFMNYNRIFIFRLENITIINEFQ